MASALSIIKTREGSVAFYEASSVQIPLLVKRYHFPSGDVTGAHGGLLFVGALAALWAASNGMASIITSLNIAYDVDDPRPWWKRRLVAIVITIGFSILLLSALVLMVFGPKLGAAGADWLGLGVFMVAWSVVSVPWRVLLGEWNWQALDGGRRVARHDVAMEQFSRGRNFYTFLWGGRSGGEEILRHSCIGFDRLQAALRHGSCSVCP
jgi:hypothetical protein